MCHRRLFHKSMPSSELRNPLASLCAIINQIVVKWIVNFCGMELGGPAPSLTPV